MGFITVKKTRNENKRRFVSEMLRVFFPDRNEAQEMLTEYLSVGRKRSQKTAQIRKKEERTPAKVKQ